MLLGLSVAPKAQGQGVGRALMQALVDWADRWGQVLRLELNVYTDNERAIALYRSFGFEIEGTHRAYALRDGKYVDSHSMARLHPNPPTLPRARRPRAQVRGVGSAIADAGQRRPDAERIGPPHP
jgi:putative acetyltransferase